uniref:NADH-ubiquinone oxidoreductase chain 2 n=1 Tax=Plectrocnemia sp. 1 YW-2021a TaxID=2823369 RepID=A0A8A9WF48_9NEOP|nr:NADH dehydrogenase subunit 2 [Plectrocnemia sp. 1 YW-2021a]
MFIMINISSTLYLISTNCWINCFLALELNLFMFIPMIFETNLFNLEMVIKYFIIQVISSVTLMIFILLYKNIWFNLIMLINMMNFCLLMKMGSSPMHYWYIEISNIISWKMFFMLSTWQKLGPLVILSYNLNFNLMILTILMNSFFSMLGGMNQISLKKILAFSSLNHLGWMIINSMISEIMMMNYFIIYMLMMMFMLINMDQLNLKFIYQIMFLKNKTVMLSFFMYFMSLSGMPPFLGFIPKWMTVNKMMESELIMLSIILILFSLLNLFYYFKISYYFILNKTLKMNFLVKFNYKIVFFMMNYIIMINFSYFIMFICYF